MAKFKVGDRVRLRSGGHAGLSATVTSVAEAGKDLWVKFEDGFEATYPVGDFVAANSRAANRASVFEYGIGDAVKLASGRKGTVIAKYADKNGDIKIDVEIGGTRFTVRPGEIDSVVRNSAVRSTNAVVANALAARNVAGIRSGNYEVTLETITLKGNTTTTVSMTDAQLKSWLGLIHCGGVYAEATSRFAKGEKYYDANVDMHPSVHIKPIL